MANARFLSRFTLSAASANNALRVNFQSGVTDEDYDLTFDGDYFWSFDNSEVAGALDFAKALDDKLTTASSGESLSWSVAMIGVSDLVTVGGTGAIVLTVTGGGGVTQIATLEFGEAETTIDPRIFGFDSTLTNRSSDSAGELISPYAARHSWCPNRPTYDNAPQSSTLMVSQSISSGGYAAPSIHFATVGAARWEVQYVDAALVSTACATEAARATAAGIAQDDPNASFECWFADAIAGGLWVRHYADIEAYTSTDYDGPYIIVIGGGTQHNSLQGAIRPMPGAADLYNCTITTIEALA